jgi:branched-chain amino acid transport system permease protein
LGAVALSGLLQGAVYAVMALGLALIYGVMRILNIAHGDLMVFAGYIVFWLFTLYGLNPFIAMVLSAGILFVVGYYLLRFVLNPSIEHPEHQLTSTVLITYGIALLISNGETIGWTGDYRSLESIYTIGTLHLGQYGFPVTSLLVLPIVFVATFAVYYFLYRTDTGLAIQACTQDRDAAKLSGISFRKMAYLTFGISTALAGVAGSLYLLDNIVYPAVGLSLTIQGLVVIVFGGLGSMKGALIGGLALGVIEAVSQLFLPSSLQDVVAYVILLIVLVVKPTGMFGKQFFFPK